MFNPANIATSISKRAENELSLYAAAIARWDDEGGASKAPEQQNIPKRKQRRHPVPTVDVEHETS